MTARERALTRALQLVALATDPSTSEHESRTAAVVACKLIRDHKLLGATGDAVDSQRPGARHWSEEVARQASVMFHGMTIDDLLRVVTSEFAKPYVRSERRGKPGPAKPRSSPSPAPAPPRRTACSIDPLEREHRIQQAMSDIRQRIHGIPEERIRNAAAAAVDAAIAQERR
jgi:hypothetical protein